MDQIAIVGLGSYLPELMHTNETLPPLDTPLTPEEIARIGVYRRGWAGAKEGIAEMGAHAAARALEQAGIDADSLDLIILSNWTQRRYIPEFAPRLKRLIGARRAVGFDICCACAGFIYGVALAANLLQNPRYRRALVVAAETTAQRARPGSKATLILGDAAGAMVLERQAGSGGRLIDYELATDGDHHEIMDISPEGYVRTFIPQKELNTLAARSIAHVVQPLLRRNGLTLDEVDWIVPHSGTAGVQHMLARTLEAPAGKLLTNYATIGNVSSASVPAALDEFRAQGTIAPGDRILSVAVGTGWYAAAMLYTL